VPNKEKNTKIKNINIVFVYTKGKMT
jgi:hypothetical protein